MVLRIGDSVVVGVGVGCSSGCAGSIGRTGSGVWLYTGCGVDEAALKVLRDLGSKSSSSSGISMGSLAESPDPRPSSSSGPGPGPQPEPELSSGSTPEPSSSSSGYGSLPAPSGWSCCSSRVISGELPVASMPSWN